MYSRFFCEIFLSANWGISYWYTARNHIYIIMLCWQWLCQYSGQVWRHSARPEVHYVFNPDHYMAVIANTTLLSLPNNVWRLIDFAPFLIIVLKFFIIILSLTLLYKYGSEPYINMIYPNWLKEKFHRKIWNTC
jgi:hypothetical protein